MRARRSLAALTLVACAHAPSPPTATPPGVSTSSPPPSPPAPAAPVDCAAPIDVDVLHHAIELSLRLDPAALSGHGEVRVRARRDTTVVALDARDLRVTAFATGGAPLPFRQSDGRVCASLPAPVRAGEERTLQLAWDVPVDRETPHVSSGQIWAGYRTSAWMPTRLDPSQRATLSLRITAPADLTVVASGRALPPEPDRGGEVGHAFVLERPSPPFLFAFAAGRFEAAEREVDGVRLRAVGPPGSDLAGALAITAPMLRFLRTHTGAPLPASEYVEAFVAGDAAQEAAGLSLLAADALDDVRKDPTEDWIFSHELAHQWFAWLVPCADFADFWLNDGFSTFLVAAIKEERWGRAAYDRELALWRKRSAKVHADGRDAPLSLSAPGAPARPPPSESELPPRGVTYARGALVLDKLRAELGDAVFWEGIRRYVSERAGKGARSEDLRAAMEAASGRDLRPFFARWVYSPAPDL